MSLYRAVFSLLELHNISSRTSMRQKIHSRLTSAILQSVSDNLYHSKMIGQHHVIEFAAE